LEFLIEEVIELMYNVFVDVETTSFHKSVRRPWEIAVIADHVSYKKVIKDVDLTGADPKSLEVSGFYKRYDQENAISELEAAKFIHSITKGKTLVGTATWFDSAVLEEMLRRHGYLPEWEGIICIQQLTSDKLGRRIQGLKNCAVALGLDYEEEGFHEAMYDAVVAKRIYETIK